MTGYKVAVEHTDTFGGTPTETSVIVPATDDEEAVSMAKKRPEWPEPDYYDEDDIELEELDTR